MNSFLSCLQAQELLSPYFDDELSREESNYLETHLEQCSTCKQKLANIKQLSSIIKTSYQTESVVSSEKEPCSKGLLPEEIENCLTIKANVSAFIDGELAKEDMIETLEHIINCDFCRKQYEKTKQTRALIKDYLQRSIKPVVSLPKPKKPYFIINKINKIKQKQRQKVITSAAAVIFVALLTLFAFDISTPQKTADISNITIGRTMLIKSQKPMSMRAENFFINEIYLTPPEEVISLLNAQ